MLSKFGEWEFVQAPWYSDAVGSAQPGQCINTYIAYNNAVTTSISDSDLDSTCLDLRNYCLMLSFLNATCVTPTVSAPYSVPNFITMGDSFIPARSLNGLPKLTNITSIESFLSNAIPVFNSAYGAHLRLLLTHWISGLTCYTLEDLFLAVCVQLDIVKQIEILISGNSNLTYADGMRDAGVRLNITKANPDIKSMRNDLVHEGVLSGPRFKNKSKADCSKVVSDSLNWLDDYLIATFNISNDLKGMPKWKHQELDAYLPSFSLVK